MSYNDLDMIEENFKKQLSVYEASYKLIYADETELAAAARKNAVLALAAGYGDGVAMAVSCFEPERAYKIREAWRSWAQQLTRVGQ